MQLHSVVDPTKRNIEVAAAGAGGTVHPRFLGTGRTVSHIPARNNGQHRDCMRMDARWARSGKSVGCQSFGQDSADRPDAPAQLEQVGIISEVAYK
jgi:hypothetical protein